MSKRVAVIGAGPAGLVSAREAQRQNLDVVVFEESDQPGGVWVYREQIEDDPLGQVPSQRIHGSLYPSLRTNLPREVMAFRDDPFDGSPLADLSAPLQTPGDQRQYPAHGEVLRYLKTYADAHDLPDRIRFNCFVEGVARTENDLWQVQVRGAESETFDAVVLANGHYRRPRVPKLPGMETFPGLLMHSHNYRHPDPFAGQRVLVFGSGSSGGDLAREISFCAAEVFWAASTFPETTPNRHQPTIARRPVPVAFDSRGSVCFADGTTLEDLDAFIFCTGYHYAFPFLEGGIVSVDDDWVHPLYRDLIPPAFPSLAFIGLPHAIVPFPLFQMQARWFLERIAGNADFPGRREMEVAIAAQESRLRAEGRPRRHFHRLGNEQFAYLDLLAAESGSAPMPAWFESMTRRSEKLRGQFPDDFREMFVPRF